MTGVLLQARLNSSRLPNKALLELGGRSVVEQAMVALHLLDVDCHVLVTDAKSRELLEPRARRCGFDVFVGPEDDVLERYVQAGREFGVDLVVRATGDNPLVSAELAGMLVALHRQAGADYSNYTGPPLGTGVETVQMAALERAFLESDDPYDHEHVTPYVYRHPDSFHVLRIDAPEEYRCPDARVTLDTIGDYQHLCRIFDELYHGKPIPTPDLVAWLRS